jgi:hypothetical protein
MEIPGVPFGVTDWSSLDTTEQVGERGVAMWRTSHVGHVRIRVVEYSPGYLADHWCTKGHFLLCLDGGLDTELADGRTFALTRGMSYQVGDNVAPHRSRTAIGAKLFVID